MHENLICATKKPLTTIVSGHHILYASLTQIRNVATGCHCSLPEL